MLIYPQLFFDHVTIAVTLRNFFYILREPHNFVKKGENLKQIRLVFQKLLSLKLWSVKYGNFCSGNNKV